MSLIAHCAGKIRDNTRCAKTSREVAHIQTHTDGYRKINKVKSFWGQHTNFQMDVKKNSPKYFLKKCCCVVEERLLYMLLPKTSRGQLIPGWALFFRHTLRLIPSMRNIPYTFKRGHAPNSVFMLFSSSCTPPPQPWTSTIVYEWKCVLGWKMC